MFMCVCVCVCVCVCLRTRLENSKNEKNRCMKYNWINKNVDLKLLKSVHMPIS